LNSQRNKKEENCEKFGAEIVSLRKELNKLNKNMKSSQSLDTILNSQRLPYDKTNLGYMGETSYEEDANPKSPRKKLKKFMKAPISVRARTKVRRSLEILLQQKAMLMLSRSPFIMQITI